MKTPRLLAALVAACVAIALAVALSAPAEHRERGPTPRGLPSHTAAIVVEARTGRVLWGANAHRRVLIASTAKLMTALVALEQVPLDETIVAPYYEGDRDESRIWLGADEPMQVADLLRGLLLASGNDAAMALAVGVAGSEQAFVARMNERAEELGMDETSYGNPIGLDDGTHSSAADLVTLTRALRRHAFFRETVAAPSIQLASGSTSRTVYNTNRLLTRWGAVDGVKTGHTRGAGYVLVGSATKRGVTVISAVLGTKSEDARDTATLALLRYGLRRAR